VQLEIRVVAFGKPFGAELDVEIIVETIQGLGFGILLKRLQRKPNISNVLS
jgi:hypothetical protein